MLVLSGRGDDDLFAAELASLLAWRELAGGDARALAIDAISAVHPVHPVEAIDAISAVHPVDAAHALERRLDLIGTDQPRDAFALLDGAVLDVGSCAATRQKEALCLR